MCEIFFWNQKTVKQIFFFLISWLRFARRRSNEVCRKQTSQIKIEKVSKVFFPSINLPSVNDDDDDEKLVFIFSFFYLDVWKCSSCLFLCFALNNQTNINLVWNFWFQTYSGWWWWEILVKKKIPKYIEQQQQVIRLKMPTPLSTSSSSSSLDQGYNLVS